MTVIVLMNLYLLVCACVGLIYGLTAAFRQKQSLYFKLMVFPIACQFFSRAFTLVTLLCYREMPDGFNIGLLGYAGFYLFLYLPNVGVIDHLLDEQKKGITKQKLISAILPAAEAAVAVSLLFVQRASIAVRISFLVLALLAGLAGYFNMKHALTPDVEGGIVRTLRKFNFVCILFEVLTLAEVGLFFFGSYSPIVLAAVLGVFYVGFLPFLKKETKKWIQ